MLVQGGCPRYANADARVGQQANKVPLGCGCRQTDFVLTAFGATTVTFMMVMYALERRGSLFILAFACDCLLACACGEAALTAFPDTNMLVGHLTGDPQEMAARATQALAHEERLLLADLVLAECVYVLESFYEVEPTRIAEMMRAAMALRSIAVVDEAMLLRALGVYEGDPRRARGRNAHGERARSHAL